MSQENTDNEPRTGGGPGNEAQGGAGSGGQSGGGDSQSRDQGGQPGEPTGQDVPVLSQRAVNALLAAERQNERRRYEEQLETERGRIRTELSQQAEQQRQQAVTEAIAAHDLQRERQSLVTSLGLTEAQAVVLEGDTPEKLREHATALFGERRESAPYIPPGGNPRPVAPAAVQGGGDLRSALARHFEGQ